MGSPHNWVKGAIEAATSGIYAWPVEMTGGGDPPYIIYTREQTTREPLLSDALGSIPADDVMPPTARFTVVTYADSYAQAWQIAGQIRAAIHRFSGSAHGETIQQSFVIDERDGDAGYLDGREQPTYTVEQTVEIAYRE
jgi:hypothetical protein